MKGSATASSERGRCNAVTQGHSDISPPESLLKLSGSLELRGKRDQSDQPLCGAQYLFPLVGSVGTNATLGLRTRSRLADPRSFEMDPDWNRSRPARAGANQRSETRQALRQFVAGCGYGRGQERGRAGAGQ